MDGRTSIGFLALSLTMFTSGCVSSPMQKGSLPTAIDETRIVKAPEGPKRQAKASTEIAFAQMKEAEADSEVMRKDPERQARLRDDARQAYQQVLKMEPNNLEATRALGRLFVKTGNMDRAEETFQKALAKNPKDGALWYELGLCANRRKNFAESTRCFSEALKLDPDNRDYLKMLGFTLAYQGEFEKGLGLLVRAQGAALAHYNIARVFLQHNQTMQARHHLELALRENAELDVARALLTELQSGRPTNQ